MEGNTVDTLHGAAPTSFDHNCSFVPGILTDRCNRCRKEWYDTCLHRQAAGGQFAQLLAHASQHHPEQPEHDLPALAVEVLVSCARQAAERLSKHVVSDDPPGHAQHESRFASIHIAVSDAVSGTATIKRRGSMRGVPGTPSFSMSAR